MGVCDENEANVLCNGLRSNGVGQMTKVLQAR